MYTVKVIEKVKNKPGTWDSIRVGVFKDNQQIGEYIRNYSSLYRTFFPFTKNEKDYALYSKNYTSTRIMSLPDCKDLGGEPSDGFGFCPTDYYIPNYRIYRFSCKISGKDEIFEWKLRDRDLREAGKDYNFITPVLYEDYGFVAGCAWGDDCSWKIQYLDLSKIEEGIIKRDDRFGYIHLPESMDLEDVIQVVHSSFVKITITKQFNPKLIKNNDYDSPDYSEDEE